MLRCSLMRSWACAFSIAHPRPLSEFRSAMGMDPWRVSALISAIMELILSLLLLLGAVVTFITSKLINFFGLEPPCIYMGCCHPLHHSRILHRYETNACFDDGEGYVYQQYRHNHHHHAYFDSDADYDLSKEIFGSSMLHHNLYPVRVHAKDYNDQIQNGTCLTCHSHDQSSIRRRLSQHKFVKRKTFDIVELRCESLQADDLPLFSARSDSESDECLKPVDQSQEMICKESYDKIEQEFKGSHVIDKSNDQACKETCVREMNTSVENSDASRSDFDDEIMDENDDLFEIPNLLLGNIAAEEEHNNIPIVLDAEVESPKNLMGTFDHFYSSLLELEKSETKLNIKECSDTVEGTGLEEREKNLQHHCSNKEHIICESCNENYLPVRVHITPGRRKDDRTTIQNVIQEICDVDVCEENLRNQCVRSFISEQKSDTNVTMSSDVCGSIGFDAEQIACNVVISQQNSDNNLTIPSDVCDRIGSETRQVEAECACNTIIFDHDSDNNVTMSSDVNGIIGLTDAEQVEVEHAGNVIILEHNTNNNGTMSCDVCDSIASGTKQVDTEYAYHTAISDHDSDNNATIFPDVFDNITSYAIHVEVEHARNAVISEHNSDNNGTVSCDESDSIGSDTKQVEAEHACYTAISDHDSDNNVTISPAMRNSIVTASYAEFVEVKCNLNDCIFASVNNGEQLPSSEHKQAEHECLESLKEALEAERAILVALELELEKERNASAVATSEAMAMISRLQEEKSAMQMEVAQIQRMLEEKAEYDEQAMALLKEILLKREKENLALEKELQMYKEKARAQNFDFMLYKESTELSSEQDKLDFLPESNEGNEMSLLLQDRFQPTADVAQLSDDEQELRLTTAHGTTRICNRSTDKTQSILDRLVCLEEELKQHQLENELPTEPRWRKSKEESTSGSLMSQNKVLTRKANNLASFECEFDMEYSEMEMNGLNPVHDIYEVNSSLVCDSTSVEETDIYDVNTDLISSTQSDNNRFLHSAKPSPIRIGTQHDSMVSSCKGANGLMEEHLFSPQSKALILRESNTPHTEDVQSLDMRLRALESDRDLLQQTLQSYKYRDTELKILQEIALHLQELRSSILKRFALGDSAEDLSVMTPSKSNIQAQKKRRYCNAMGRVNVSLAQQKSI